MIVDPTGTPTTVAGAIRHAAQLTGADFKYLLATAQVESNLNPHAGVATSSARGLFQFIEQTWLTTLKEQGPALGYGPYAEAITRLPSGRYAVTDPQMYRSIMNLRSDPTANAVMAGAFTRGNATRLSERLGRNPTEGELYVAHFLGPAGAGRLINLAQSQPLASAAEAFPRAAKANPSIFYDRQGRPRSASEVYRVLVGRYDVARGGRQNATMAVAALDQPGAPAPALDGKLANIVSAPGATSAPVMRDPVALAETYAEASRLSVPRAAVSSAARPVFNSLFSAGSRADAIAPMVNALWTTPAHGPVASPADPGGGTLDLFRDQTPNARGLFGRRV
jgi:transglycosylase-like protein with SLT domain